MFFLVDNEVVVVWWIYILLILNIFFVDSFYCCKIGNSECLLIGYYLGFIWFLCNF